MNTSYARIHADIDLNAVIYNMNSMKKKYDNSMKIAAVVKSDAYGHGAVPIARVIDNLVDFYCVATAQEAINLRLHRITKPILILGPVPCDDYTDIVKEDIRTSIFTLEQAEALSDTAVANAKTAYAHIAVDTGMNRIGLEPDNNSVDLIRKISLLPGICLEGIFTHMYKADCSDLSSAKTQYEIFNDFTSKLESQGLCPPIKHISNSAGIMTGIGKNYDMVRAGITMYGIYPSDEVDRSLLDIKPVMSLKSVVTYIKTIKSGEEVSYGGTYRADKDTRVATVPVGYADGYPRDLSGKGFVLIDGKRANILGRICMDQFMVDVSAIPEAKIGSLVTLLGTDGSDSITVDVLSSRCHRFPYEFICDISKRVPRVYYRDSVEIGTKDYQKDMYMDFL